MATQQQEENNQYLTFNLDGEVFAVGVNKVREVLDFSEVTSIPQTPTYMRGVINLRGSVIPVIDMRSKFGLPAAVETVNTCIIIVEVEMGNETTVLGALVDSVQEVLDMEAEQIEPPPRLGSRMNSDFLHGMGKYDENFVMILNIDKVFSSEELAMVQQD
ncbi:MAG: purine-binding chemotaxis protein CheW [Deltaproteobacteria bacterium]|nr:purine-binding chemotaxis protein CheW [Deltaproteobacteria bacterium]